MTRRHRKNVPLIWLMTDERIGDAALLAAVARLPKGRGGIVFRHYRTDAAARRALFDAVQAIARRRRLTLLLAGDARMAAAWRANGWHGRDGRCGTVRPLLHSAPVHDLRERIAAQRASADLVFVSPLFPTRSHPAASSLGPLRFAALAYGAIMPVMALGGVTRAHRHRLKAIGADGWAAIDGLTGS